MSSALLNSSSAQCICTTLVLEILWVWSFYIGAKSGAEQRVRKTACMFGFCICMHVPLNKAWSKRIKCFGEFSVIYILFQLTGNGRFGITVPILLLKGSVSTFFFCMSSYMFIKQKLSNFSDYSIFLVGLEISFRQKIISTIYIYIYFFFLGGGWGGGNGAWYPYPAV